MKLGIVFNVPNMIGYIRIVLLVFSVFASELAFGMLYISSSALDFFDGYFARMFNQCTVLGSCLDMITDRVSTVVISFRIIQRKGEFLPLLSLYAIVDLISHFVYFLMAALEGKHHKRAGNRILQIYYNKRVLGPICMLSELFFVYLHYFDGHGCILYCLTGVAVVKTTFHIAQLFEAISGISEIKERKAGNKVC